MDLRNSNPVDLQTEAAELLHVAETTLHAIAGGADLASRYSAIEQAFRSLKEALGQPQMGEFGSLMKSLSDSWMRFQGRDGIAREQLEFFLRAIGAAKMFLTEYAAAARPLQER